MRHGPFPFEARYKPISDYGVIGDLRTVALVGLDGSIDWLCLPSFDSPSVFGAILDRDKGGFFQIAPREECTPTQHYFPDTNVLVTRFAMDNGIAEVTDFMAVPADPSAEFRQRLIRRVSCTRGEIPMRLECRPAFDYGRQPPRVEVDRHAAVFHGPDVTLGLSSPFALQADKQGVTVDFSLKENEAASFVLQRVKDLADSEAHEFSDRRYAELLDTTTEYWHEWIGHCTYNGRWRETVHRSALVLKLLCHEPTGAMVAAATTSLPEVPQGSRNWDYRYVWLRDAAFTVYAFIRLGFKNEATAYMKWLHERIEACDREGSLQPVYRVDGSADLKEQELDHLEGYQGARPVRVGNRAAEQFQMDYYGALLDGIYLHNKHVGLVTSQDWEDIRRIIGWVIEHWRKEDQSIWEARGEPRHFVYSKMMCWVAIDRAIRLAIKRSFPAPLDEWRAERDALYEEIMEEGWDEEKGSFVESYGSDRLDAGLLLMPLVFFIAPHDPRMLRTIEAIHKGLTADHLVYRYTPDGADGLPGKEGTFSLCTFWYVEALTRAGRAHEARNIFERMLGYANHLGLYSEEIGLRGDHLGNFPQAFTHLSLISAAVNLDRALG